MVITTNYVNELQIGEIVGLIQNGESMINLDKDDVKSVLVGKEGVLYQANQEEGMENSTFMKNFFGALKENEVVQGCTSMLISIGMSPEDPMMMDDIEIIHDFFESIHNENMESKWGLKNNEAGERMSILTICTKEK